MIKDEIIESSTKSNGKIITQDQDKMIEMLVKVIDFLVICRKQMLLYLQFISFDTIKPV